MNAKRHDPKAKTKAKRPSRGPRLSPKRAVQISLDRSLLQQVDSDEEAQERGRSAFITEAIVSYLRAKREKEIDDQFVAALSGHADEILEESLPFIHAQVWPPEDDLVEADPAPVSAPKTRRGR